MYCFFLRLSIFGCICVAVPSFAEAEAAVEAAAAVAAAAAEVAEAVEAAVEAEEAVEAEAAVETEAAAVRLLAGWYLAGWTPVHDWDWVRISAE